MEVLGSIPELGFLATACCFLEQETFLHCSSHSAVKPGTYCISYIGAQLKNSLLADAVLPGEITVQTKNFIVCHEAYITTIW